jgi:pimeloyl-ACP methyl ester carboxylesterase
MQGQVPLLSALVTLSFCGAIQSAHAGKPLALRECRLEGAGALGSAAAQCGWYSTPENPDEPQGRQLRLHVAVIPALRLKPAPDPLFVFSGGPGQAASDFYLSVQAAFARIRRDRDIVLIDQRGTGRSNRLDCQLPDENLAGIDPAGLGQLVQACLDALPGDPRFYTTSIAVRDLENVRVALGYQSINLYGVSYGTRVAQHYMRRYPTTVRSAVLDGAVPAGIGLGPEIAIEAQRALDGVFQRCADDQDCAREFPQIDRQFRTLQARLRARPVTVQVADPVTARVDQVTVDSGRLAAAVRLLTYSDETVSTLPLLIHEAQVLGQPQALAAQYLMIKRSTESSIAGGMHFAVVCSEDAPRWGQAGISEERLADTYIGPSFMAALRAVCGQWPRGPVDEDFAAPMRSDVPVLILSGGNDPVTPRRYADQVLTGFAHGKHLVLEGQGHGQLANSCVPRVISQFIERGTAAAIDDACIRNITPAPFMLSRTAPAP